MERRQAGYMIIKTHAATYRCASSASSRAVSSVGAH